MNCGDICERILNLNNGNVLGRILDNTLMKATKKWGILNQHSKLCKQLTKSYIDEVNLDTRFSLEHIMQEQTKFQHNLDSLKHP